MFTNNSRFAIEQFNFVFSLNAFSKSLLYSPLAFLVLGNPRILLVFPHTRDYSKCKSYKHINLFAGNRIFGITCTSDYCSRINNFN